MDDWGTPYDSGNLHVFFVCFGLSSGKLQVSYGFFFIGSFTIKGPVLYIYIYFFFVYQRVNNRDVYQQMLPMAAICLVVSKIGYVEWELG